MSNDMMVELKEKGSKTISVGLKLCNGALLIHPKGYNDFYGDAPIMLEVYEDKLRLIIWSDRDCQDPTHIVDMTRAQK